MIFNYVIFSKQSGLYFFTHPYSVSHLSKNNLLFFNSKRRQLNSQSENGDDPKKQQESSVWKKRCSKKFRKIHRETHVPETLFNKFAGREDAYAEWLKYTDCLAIVANCSQNLETNEYCFFELKKAIESRIKGEEQLIDINKSKKFLRDKFDEYDKKRTQMKSEMCYNVMPRFFSWK